MSRPALQPTSAASARKIRRKATPVAPGTRCGDWALLRRCTGRCRGRTWRRHRVVYMASASGVAAYTGVGARNAQRAARLVLSARSLFEPHSQCATCASAAANTRSRAISARIRTRSTASAGSARGRSTRRATDRARLTLDARPRVDGDRRAGHGRSARRRRSSSPRGRRTTAACCR